MLALKLNTVSQDSLPVVGGIFLHNHHKDECSDKQYPQLNNLTIKQKVLPFCLPPKELYIYVYNCHIFVIEMAYDILMKTC